MSTVSSDRRRWIALALLAMAQFVVVLDASIVNVALPSIGRGLHFSQDSLSWVVNAYVLTFGGFLLLRAALLFGQWGIHIQQALGQRHLYAFCGDIHVPEKGLGEGDESLVSAGAFDDEQRHGGGFEIDVGNLADVFLCFSSVDVATDEFADVDLVVGEGRALFAGDRYFHAPQSLSVVD